MNSLPYSGHLIDSLTELVDSKFASGVRRESLSGDARIAAERSDGPIRTANNGPLAIQEFECGSCGAITKAATWQQAMDLHDCPAYDERDSAHFIQQRVIAEGLR